MSLREFTNKHYKIIYFIAMVGVGLWVAYIKGWILADFKSISAKEALNLIKSKNYVVLDIRDKKDWQKGHIKGAISISLNELEKRANELEKFKNKEILVCSKSGINGVKASRILSKLGYKPINIKSGILGLAIEGAKKYPELFEKEVN